MPEEKQKLDGETNELLNQQLKVKEFVDGDWRFVRSKFVEKILDLQSVMNVPDGNAEQIVIDMKARRLAVTLLFDFMRDIEGTAAQFKANTETVAEEEAIIKEF